MAEGDSDVYQVFQEYQESSVTYIVQIFASLAFVENFLILCFFLRILHRTSQSPYSTVPSAMVSPPAFIITQLHEAKITSSKSRSLSHSGHQQFSPSIIAGRSKSENPWFRTTPESLKSIYYSRVGQSSLDWQWSKRRFKPALDCLNSGMLDLCCLGSFASSSFMVQWNLAGEAPLASSSDSSTDSSTPIYYYIFQRGFIFSSSTYSRSTKSIFYYYASLISSLGGMIELEN